MNRLKAGGTLPHGTAGELVLAEQMPAARVFVQRLEARRGTPLDPLEVDLPVGRYRLQGRLRGLQPGGLLDYRFAKLRAKDRLGAWVRHLVLNMLRPPGVETCSLYMGEDLTLKLEPVEDAEALLCDLLEFRWAGLGWFLLLCLCLLF